MQILVDGEAGAGPLGRGNHRKLDVPRHITGHIDPGNARPPLRITDEAAFLLVAAAQCLQQRRARVLPGGKEQRLPAELLPVGKNDGAEPTIDRA
jgi:hypothetical protein